MALAGIPIFAESVLTCFDFVESKNGSISTSHVLHVYESYKVNQILQAQMFHTGLVKWADNGYPWVNSL